MRVRPATLDDTRGIATVHVRGWQAAYGGILPRKFLDALSVDEREARWRRLARVTMPCRPVQPGLAEHPV